MTITAVEPIRDDRAAIDKAFSLLSTLGEHSASPLGVSELARRTQLSKSTAFRVLGMLDRNAMVERAPNEAARFPHSRMARNLRPLVPHTFWRKFMALPDLLSRPLALPVVAAPMFISSVPDLVIAQCQAGVVGSFPALNARPASLLAE